MVQIRGTQPLDLGDARGDAPAEDVDWVDRTGRVRIDTGASRAALLRGAEHAVAQVARGRCGGERTEPGRGFLQPRRLGRRRRVGPEP